MSMYQYKPKRKIISIGITLGIVARKWLFYHICDNHKHKCVFCLYVAVVLRDVIDMPIRMAQWCKIWPRSTKI